MLSGWYPSLYFGEDPQAWQPTVAAVHTYPDEAGALHILHAGVGDTRYMVAVIDSESDVRTYVGPVYSYYESIENGQRLTDQEWGARVSSARRPTVPGWLAELSAGPAKRELGPPAKHTAE